MTDQIAVYSLGLMRLADEIRTMTGLEPVHRILSPSSCSAVAGWGHKPTATRARRAARRNNLPYIAFEDGFLRSLKPGTAQRPVSMVMDRSGIYYDARQPSDLETLLETAVFRPEETEKAEEIIAAIARNGLSKYNHGTDVADLSGDGDRSPIVLIVDQTAGDASIAGGLATAADFERMVDAAVDENPGATLIAKLHPETLAGTKQGHIEPAARRHGLRLLASHVSPWALLRHKPRVYTVSSQFGFEALLAGCRVTCHGMPFYAGWGLTDDRQHLARRTKRRTIAELAAAVYLRYSRFFDAWRRTAIDPLTAIDQLTFLRQTFLANANPVVCLGMPRWKRRAVTAMLDGPAGPPTFRASMGGEKPLAGSQTPTFAAWGVKALKLRPMLEARRQSCIAIEDGFVRSVGLGAAFVQPLSLVFDSRGLYFDPSRPSDIEHLLSGLDVPAEDVARASVLRRRILEARITKYNMRTADIRLPALPQGREVVLVPGQVADDAAIEWGRVAGFDAGTNINAQLLTRVRQRHPDAFVIFKPHPDVEDMGRQGALGINDGTGHADYIARKTPLDALFTCCHRVEVYSSLSGFEALIRGLPVTAHGIPFYAGWGLTEDLAHIDRRGRKRTLDELVAVALIHYAHYWDPGSGLVCPPEVSIDRIADMGNTENTLVRRAGRLLGKTVIAGRRTKRAFKGTGR